MAIFKTTFGDAPNHELFYPNVLTSDLKLDASKVQDSFRRVFDAIYKINPPPGSRKSSSVLGTFGFVEQFTINLSTDVFVLMGENWNSSTAGVSWNAHQLTYGGTQYQIAAGGPTTNKFIYWSLDNANMYQSSATFPDLSFKDTRSGSTAAGLVGVWNASDGKFYPFWGTKLAPAFISTALIEDLAVTNAKIQDLQASKITAGTLVAGVIYAGDVSASQITTGTLAASVTITLTQSDTVPAKFIFGSQAQMFAKNSVAQVFFQPLGTSTQTLFIGSSTATTNRWSLVNIAAEALVLVSDNGAGTQRQYLQGTGTDSFKFVFQDLGWNVNIRSTALYTTGTMDLGLSALPWTNLYLTGNLVTPITNQYVIYSSSGTLTGSSNFKYNGTDVTILSGALAFTSGQGIKSGNTAYVVASDAEIYQSSTKVFAINTSGTHINIGGTYYNLSVVAGIVNAT